MRATQRNRTAWTLMELLMVTAIITVLLSLGLALIRMVGIQSRRTECAADLRQVGMAFAGFAQDHRGLLPRLNGWDSSSGVLDYVDATNRSSGVIHGCPEYNSANYGGDRFSATGYVYNCFLAQETQPGQHNYFDPLAINWMGCSPRDWRLPGLTSLSDRFLLGDGSDWYVGGSGSVSFNNVADRHRAVFRAEGGSGGPNGRKTRSPGLVNVLFCDLHVASVSKGYAGDAILDPTQIR